jgi:hypothetical protein
MEHHMSKRSKDISSQSNSNGADSMSRRTNASSSQPSSTNKQFEARPEVAELSRRIIATLTGVNDEISDDTLEQIIGVPIGPGNHAMQVALRHMERADRPLLFRRKRGIGWKRETDSDIVEGSEGALKKLSRGARRGSRRLGKVANFVGLSNELQLQAATNQTRLFAIAEVASVRKPRKIVSSVPDPQSLTAAIKLAASV